MCGLGGIINLQPREFDYTKFCVLGISNDARGGDSCGVFIDGKYEYGVGGRRYFSNFFLDSSVINGTKEAQIALVHDRKASVGLINEKTAQPVVIKNEQGKVSYVLMHNGTIHNYEELAEKYIPKIDIKGLTDSQVMALIFYHTGYKALEEYIGAAAFAIIDYRGEDPFPLFFRGASKVQSTDIQESEERPLCYIIDKEKEQLIFSSIGSYLYSFVRGEVAYNFPANTLVSFDGTNIVAIKSYNRSKCTQKKVVKSFYYNYYPASSCYVEVDLDNNLYSYKGKYLHDKIVITKWGRVVTKTKKENKEDLYTVWFYNGVPLKSESCFKYLEEARKKSGLKLSEFFAKKEVLIRFFSMVPYLQIEGLWYEVTGPNSIKLYTGEIPFLTMVQRIKCENGVGSRDCNGSYKLTEEILSKVYVVNFQTLANESNK